MSVFHPAGAKGLYPEAQLKIAYLTYRGKPHVGVHLFRDTDADYRTIKDWLEGAVLGGPCNTGQN